METSLNQFKEKRRNSEKRKEKSRDAARCRRSKESEIFSSLSQVLPLPASVSSHLDKASIMRLVIAHLRIRDLFKSIELKEESLSTDTYDSFFMKALGGIVLVLSLEGEVIFISSNVSSILGVSQIDLLGQSIYDVSHPCDHGEIRDILSGKVIPKGQISFFARIKCTLTNKGRNVNIKSAFYKVLHITGNFVSASDDKDKLRFVTVAHPIPHPVDIETPLGTYTFLSKHSLDMKFTYADERMKQFLGYNPGSLLGKSLYNYHHVQDNKDIEKAFKSLFAKGQSETGQYRFLAKGGGYVWVCTQATVIYCDKGYKPQSVVCVNYVVSEKMNEVEIYSTDQLGELKETPEDSEEELPTEGTSTASLLVSIKSEQTFARPQPATSKIFAPRTPDMNKGFLIFADDDSGFTMLKDEPEDLTHLAPTAGDVCVPLGNDSNFDEMLNDILPNNFCPLIDEDKDAPFFSYRDDCSTGSLSPSHTQSPEGCSLPSLCSFGDETAAFEESALKPLLDLDIVDTDSNDISVKVPYINVDKTDDLPLLTPSDLLWNVNFSEHNSTSSSSRCSPTPRDVKPREDFQCLSQLMQVDKEDLLNKYPDQGGGSAQFGILFNPSQTLIDSERRKRVSSLKQETAKKRKQSGSVLDGSSVIMNLLTSSGRDINGDYICIDPRQISKCIRNNS